MFFVISKILSFLISPLTWVIALALLSLLLRNPKTKRRLLRIAIVAALFFSNTFIAKEFMRLWEPAPVALTELKRNYDAVIVLGGGMATTDERQHTTTFRHNTDRLLQSVWLYQNGYADRIVLSGGAGTLQYRNMREASILYNYLIEIGIPAEVVLVDSLSDNTHENAVNTAKLLSDSIPGGSFLLITSASHMRRSLACFENEGVVADPYPVDFTAGSRQWNIMNMLVPQTEGFAIWEELLHEMIGFLVYRIAGYL